MAQEYIAGTITGARTIHTYPSSSGKPAEISPWYTGNAIYNTYEISRPVAGEYIRVEYRVHVKPAGAKVIGYKIRGNYSLQGGGTNSTTWHLSFTVYSASGSLLADEYRTGKSNYNNVAQFAIAEKDGTTYQDERDVFVRIGQIGYIGSYNSVSIESIGILTAPPDLSLSFSPASVIAGEVITVNTIGRFNQDLQLKLSANNVDLTPTPIKIDADSKPITTKASWFDDTAESGNTLSVAATLTDPEDSRTATADFTLERPKALTATATSPKSTTINAADSIVFSWDVSGSYGTQEKAELQYSYDNANWYTLGSITGSKTSLDPIAAANFEDGTVYWRVRILSTYGIWSAWSSASFTIRYYAATVTLTAPTSGSRDGSQKITFAWTITAGSGTINKTQMEYSVDDGINWEQVFNASGEKTSYTSEPGTFPAGKIIWRIRVEDSYSGWSTWKQAAFTVIYTAASITLTSPTSGQRNGSEEISFAWNITNGSGSIVKTIMEVSTDDGLSWNEKVNKNEKATSYTARAAEFPAGTVKWRVKAKNQYQDDYTVSSTGSMTIVYSAVSQISPVNSPTSGRIPASVDQTYAVALTPSAPVYTPFTIQSATMYWRAGTSGDYTAVPMTASRANASVTIPGGTFPSGTIQWYAEALDNTGATRTTDVYTLLALNANVEAVPLSPINTIEGTSREITFTWLYYSLDGTAQSRALLEYSRDGESWDTIADVPGSGTAYTAPAGFFTSAGVVYWRVQAFNASGTAGPKSAAVSFTLFGSSSVTSVIGDGKPFTTVKWQAEGQVSYELMIGDKHIGPYFGADVRSYKLAEPLEDGLYTVRVRIQNKYGIWSEWAEAEMSVQNQPGLGIIIQDARSGLIGAPYTYRGSISILSFAPGDFFMILRDGKYIGKTTRLYFEDRIPIGVHRYQVYQALADGYVDRSNIITIDIKTKFPVIAPLAGGDFIELRLSTDADRAQDFQRSREVARMHYSGARYPSSEVGEAETLSVSFDAAWKQTDKAAADAFEALVGEDVIFKTPGGKFIVGTLEGYELHDPHFYKSYRCSLQQGDWRDFTNADA